MADNTNSLFNKFSRYVGGGTAETSTGFIEWWERTVFQPDVTDITYVVETGLANRLDLISTSFYNEPRWWWLIAQFNNILDPFNEVPQGRILQIPALARLPLLIGTQQGGVASTREPVNLIAPIIS